MIDVRCRFGWHQWSKWEVIREGRYIKRQVPLDADVDAARTKKDIEDGFGNLFKEQARHCESCGRLELRTAYA